MKVYACYNKDVNIRRNSSSGGVYYLLAKNVLMKHGIVYAACYRGFDVVHERITSIDKLYDSCSSKYAQSYIGECYRTIEEDLKRYTCVLFVGTPCQCAAIKAFLKNDYSNLLIVDIVCHGVPSSKVFKTYMQEQRILQPVDQVNMRDKSSGWSNYNYSWSFSNSNKTVFVNNRDVVYMQGFVNNLYLRPSCYSCRFKGLERDTDLTLGDFWGVWDLMPQFDDNKGISVVLVNSEVGKCSFKEIEPALVLEEVNDIQKVVHYNPSILSSSLYLKNRSVFFKTFEATGRVDVSVNNALKKSMFSRLKNIVKKVIRCEGRRI